VFVTYWTWRGIFFVNVPIGVVLLALGLHYLPRDRVRPDRGARRPMDLGGMALLGVGALALMFGISYLGEAGASAASLLFIVPVVVGVLGLAWFGLHIRRAPEPFLNPMFIAGRGFAAVNVINILYGGAVAGLLALVPLYAVERYGVSTLASGTVLTAEGVAVIVMSGLAAMALRRTGYRQPMYVGSVIIVLGFVGLAVRPVGVSPYVWLAISGALTGFGSGWSSPASRNACLQLVPDASPALAALRSMGRMIGQIVAVSVTATVIAQAASPGLAAARVFLGFAVLLVVCLPVIARVPEHRGAW
jgi:MFS family permease